MRVYLDSAPIIYLVENVSPHIDYLLSRLANENALQICSDLSRLECRVFPVREQKTTLSAAFDAYFNTIINEIVPLTSTVIDLGTEIRAQYGFKTPDALHLACAVSANCDLFMTNDKQLERFQEIAVEVITAG